ncbi:MAG: hypothetical protein GW856_02780 [Cyanobacteria bacterium]|nr:hypothetical protein [Cyanobacteria bacterium CG_2015-16_32_12]
MPRNTGKRTPVTVTTGISNGVAVIVIKYAFLSGLKDTLRNDFRQTEILSNIDVAQLVFKVNNFKPPRASVYDGNTYGYEGSFCSSSAVASLKANGANITKLKFKPPALSGVSKSSLYYCTINGLKYGYRVNDLSLPSDFATATGLTLAGSNDIILMGASFPKMGQAKYIDPTTGKVKSYMCDPGSYENLKGNWSKGKPPLSTSADFAALLGI